MKYTLLPGIAILAIVLASSMLFGNVQDEESYKEAITVPNMPQNIYSYFLKFLPITTTGFIFAGVSIILLSLLAIRTKDENISIIISLLIFSPTFIFYTINGSQTLFALTLFLSAIVISKYSKWAGYVIAILLGTLDTNLGIFSALGFLALSAYEKAEELRKMFLLSTAVTALWGILFYTPTIPQFSIVTILGELIFEFGGISGSSIITLIIAITGALVFWPKTPPTFVVPTTILTLLAILTKNTLLFHILISVVAGPVVARMIHVRWSVELLKISSLVVLFVFLLINIFSFYTNYNSLDNSELIKDIENNIPQEAVILTSSQYGYTIEYLTGIHTFSKNDEDNIIAELIYRSIDLEETVNLLENKNITHIIITKEMKEEIWQGRTKELLIMVKDKDHFITIFASDEIDIYKFERRATK